MDIIVLRLYDIEQPSDIYEKIIKATPMAYSNIQRLGQLCKEYNNFQEIEDFINNNFEEVEYDEFVLEY